VLLRGVILQAAERLEEANLEAAIAVILLVAGAGRHWAAGRGKKWRGSVGAAAACQLRTKAW